MIVVLFITLGVIIAALLAIWAITLIRYELTPRHFKVRWLGLTLRRIPLRDIQSVSKRRRSGLAEHWWNTLRPGHRTLVIRRQHGWCKNIIVTPRHRYILRADLEKAVQAAKTREETKEAPLSN